MRHLPSEEGKITLNRLGVIIISILTGKILFPFLAPFFLLILYGDSSRIIRNRYDFKSYIVDPGSPPIDYFFAHLKTIWPILFIVAVIIGLIIRFNSKRIIRATFLLIIAVSCILSILCFYINTQQFLIILLPLLSAYIFTSTLTQEKNLLDKIHWFSIILCCQIILITQGLSLLHAINGLYFFIATAICFLVAVLVRKDLRKSIRWDYEQMMIYKNKLFETINANRLLSLFLCAFLISVLWRMLLIAYFPPSGFDGLNHHLTRVVYWMQYQTLNHFYTNNPWLLHYPINAEILFLWTMVASKLDFLCTYIQFSSYLLAGTLIYKCLRQYLNVSTSTSLIAMLIWFCLPSSVVESTNIKNNMVVAYFSMVGLVYLLLGCSANTKYLLFSAIGLSLAIGTKSTSFFLLIPLVSLVGFYLITRRWPIKRILFWSIAVFISWILLSSYNYVLNYLECRNVFGPPNFIDKHTIASPNFIVAASNFFQYLFQIMTNQSGMHFYLSGMSENYNMICASFGQHLFQWFNIPSNLPEGTYRHYRFYFDSWNHKFSLCEHSVFWGLIGQILILVMTYIFLRKILLFKRLNNQNNSKYTFFAVLFLGYLICFSSLARWDPWGSRVMTIMGLVGSPMLALIFGTNKIFFNRISSWLIIYSIFLLIPATFMNPSAALKPDPVDRGASVRKSYYPVQGQSYYLRGWTHLPRNRDRLGLRYSLYPDNEYFIRNFEASVPSHSQVAVILDQEELTYSLFGERFNKKIIPVNSQNIDHQSPDFLMASLKVLSKDPPLTDSILTKYTYINTLGRTTASWPFQINLYRKNTHVRYKERRSNLFRRHKYCFAPYGRSQ